MKGRKALRARTARALPHGRCDLYYYKIPSPDDLWHVIPWFDHMITARYIRPYETADVPRYTPEGTVPVSGGEPDWSAEWTTGKATTPTRSRILRGGGPRRGARRGGPDVAVIPREVDAAGDTLYKTYCARLPRAGGRRQGPVVRRIGAPSLLTGARAATATATSTASFATAEGSCRGTATRCICPATAGPSSTTCGSSRRAAPARPEPAGAAVGIPPAPSATGSTGGRPR